MSSEGYNLIGNTSGCTIGGTTTGNIVNVNPRLGALADNGGPAQTQALLPASQFCLPSGGCSFILPSPAIDAGNPATPGSTTSGACAASDQRAVTRPIDGTGDGTARCDMGAYEAPAGSNQGAFAVTPQPASAAVGQHLPLGFSWTVPSGGWRKLDSLQLVLRDDQGTAIWLRFHEVTGNPGTFSLVDPEDYSVGQEFAPGSPNRLETNTARVYLATSSVDGPPGPTVKLTIDLGFKPQAAGRTFDVLVAAIDDTGKAEGLTKAGTLTVQGAMH